MKLRTLSIKLGFAQWEKVVFHFARLPAGIDVLLVLNSGLNKVDVGKKDARIKGQDFVFQVQADQPKELKDQLQQVKPLSPPYVPGLDKILENRQEVFALEQGSAASNLPALEIEVLPGASPMRLLPHHVSVENERILKIRTQGDAGQGNR